MTALIAVKYLGDPDLEESLREGLSKQFESFPDDWRVSVLGSQKTTTWEIKVVAPDGRTEFLNVHGEENGHRVEKIVTEALQIAKGLENSRG